MKPDPPVTKTVLMMSSWAREHCCSPAMTQVIAPRDAVALLTREDFHRHVAVAQRAAGQVEPHDPPLLARQIDPIIATLCHAIEPADIERARTAVAKRRENTRAAGIAIDRPKSNLVNAAAAPSGK